MDDRKEVPELEIRVVIRFDGSKRYPAPLLLETIDRVSQGIVDAEARQLDALQTAFPEIQPGVFVEMKDRLAGLRGRAMNLESASTGSINLEFGVASLAIWLLQTMIGKTVEEAWLKSRLHARIIEFVKRGLQSKVTDMVTWISEPNQDHPVSQKVSSRQVDDWCYEITVTVNNIYPESVIPPEGELLREWGESSV